MLKKFLTIKQNDKCYIKMINRTESSCNLLILDPSILASTKKVINISKEMNITVEILWQMKHKKENFMNLINCHYKYDDSRIITVFFDKIVYYTNDMKLYKKFGYYKNIKQLERKIKLYDIEFKNP